MKIKLPEGSTSISHEGVQYDAEDGVIELQEGASFEALLSHGCEVVVESQPTQEELDAAAAEQAKLEEMERQADAEAQAARDKIAADEAAAETARIAAEAQAQADAEAAAEAAKVAAQAEAAKEVKTDAAPAIKAVAAPKKASK